MTNTFISSIDLNAAFASNTPPLIFDVRKKPAFDAEPDLIPTATWQIHDQVETWAKEIPTSARIVVYCVHGHEVSQNAAQHLRDLGYNARYLQGGFEAWKCAGFKLVDTHAKGSK